MLTGLANYLFGLNEYSEEALENLFKETPVKGSDGDDWILVELKQPKSDLSADSSEQPTEAGSGSLTSSKNCELPENEPENGISAEDSSSDVDGESTNKENDSDNKLLTASNFPTTATSDDSEDKEDEEEDEDDEDDDRDDGEADGMIGDNINARNQETANKRKKRKSRDNNHTGTMEGSWFVTPPPCFVSHKKSSKKVSASPLEDILIEYPSISVFHSHTSSLDSFYPLPSTSSLSPTTTITLGSSSSPLSLVSPSSCTSNESKPNNDQCLATRRIIDTVSIIAVTVEKLARMTSGAPKGSNRSNRGHHNGSSSNSNENNVEMNLRQPPRGAEARGAPIENHERNAGYLSDITNHHLAPMQKAINQGSQKYLKKSFLNRQNLVKFQSNRRPTRRQRCTQRPSGYSNNRKMC